MALTAVWDGPAGPAGGWPGTGMAHEACFFQDEAGLVDRCRPFLADGLAAGHEAILIATAAVRDSLLDSLGPDADRVTAMEISETWPGGHQTLLFWDALQRDMSRRGRPWRIVAEPFWVGRPEAQDWHRFEASVNVTYATLPSYVLCLHDRRRMSEEVAAEVKRTHPLVHDGSGPHPSPSFVEPADYVAAAQPAWVPRPEGAATDRPSSAHRARMFTTPMVMAAGLGDRVDDALVAVSELVTNGFEAGSQPVVTAWTGSGHLVIEVADEAAGGVAPLAGYTPPSATDESGRGLWLAWALSDDTAVRSGPDGTAIRMFFRLPAGT